MNSKGRFTGLRTVALLSAAAAASLLASGAHAHDATNWPIAGDSLKMSYNSTGSKTKFQFKSAQEGNINPFSLHHNPVMDGATLVVRGTGLYAGNTGIIELEANRWSPIGSPESPKGYKYKGDPSSTQGVSQVQIKSGRDTGSIKIKAGGFYWPFDILGPQDSVEIVLTIGEYKFCADFSAANETVFKVNEAGEVSATGATQGDACPAVCGNGIVESPETCDDQNLNDNDTCTNECTGCAVSDVEYASTFEGIQKIIFDNELYGCSTTACHGDDTPEGGMDLREGNSYDALVGVASQIDPNTKRVFPGDQDLSMLYMKIAERTLGTPDAPSGSMPVGLTTVTEDHLEAIRLWIRGGAPETGVVAGTAELLGSCLPEPTPLDIPQPPVPDPDDGVQFAMPAYTLESQSEIEGCVASYYDLSSIVPADKMVDCPGAFPGTNDTGTNAGKCFSFNGNSLAQDAQSHHSIVYIYPGNYPHTDPGWGSWRCYGGPTPGAACDATVANSCGSGGTCGSKFHPGVACLEFGGENWGAPDFNTGFAQQFSGSQESTADFGYPAGVYGVLPLKGLIVWNSHAFNLTNTDTEMEAWINMTFTNDRDFPARGLFQNDWIFTQNVPPFQQREYCATHTFQAGTRLFQLSSHTHKRGIRWRYYDAPQTPCGPGSGGFTDPSCTAGNPSDIFYESYDYSDPTTLNFDPPKAFLSSNVNERTIKFCALFDNGFSDPDDVKRRSTSPEVTNDLPVGGPCAISETYCVGGANKGMLCAGDNNACPGSVCDACYLKGGVTTEDEMFIALGAYYVNP